MIATVCEISRGSELRLEAPFQEYHTFNAGFRKCIYYYLCTNVSKALCANNNIATICDSLSLL